MSKRLKFILIVLMFATVPLHAAEEPSSVNTNGATAGVNVVPALTQEQRLGRKLFFDKGLSTPRGQACASCHRPKFAFTDPDKSSPTSEGVNLGRFGKRNAPTLMYSNSDAKPTLAFDSVGGFWAGGLFWDGRVDTLANQAQHPLLNPVEMANPSKAAVVRKVQRSEYRHLFKRVYGADAFADTDLAFTKITEAIAAYEKSARFTPFSSKFDAAREVPPRATLTAQESYGLDLFNQLGCAVCHPILPVGGVSAPGTDFSYRNIGVPKNPENPFYGMSADINPDGAAFVDLGLAGNGDLTKFPPDSPEWKKQRGKFKVPTVRNIALTAPYGHNGYFKTLRGLIEFYNSRDTKARCVNGAGRPVSLPEQDALAQDCWPAPEVAANVDREIRGGAAMGSFFLFPEDIDAIVAFLNTLTDGWQPDAAP